MPTEKRSSVVLINPNCGGNYVQSTITREHLGLGYLTAELRQAGFEAETIDSRISKHTPDEAVKEIEALSPFLVGFSIIAKDATQWSQTVIDLLRSNNQRIHFTAGNYFPTLQTDRALKSIPGVDSLVIREGDITLSELAKRISLDQEWRDIDGIAYRADGKTTINKNRPLVRDLDSLPFPEHTAQRYELKEYAILGSTGCYCRCTFCSIDPFFNKGNSSDRWRYRSPQSIASEMKTLTTSNPNIRVFRFVDPDFVGAPRHINRLKEVVREFRNQKVDVEWIIDTRTAVVNGLPDQVWLDLKSVGLREIYLGIETASPHIKRKMAKGTSIEDDRRAIEKLNRLGIRVRYGFMMITPWTTEDDIEPNARALAELGFPRLDKFFQEMYVVPQTKAEELLRATTHIWFDHDGNGEYYTYGLPRAVNNLRQVARALTSSCPDFLNRYQIAHEKIRKQLEGSGQSGQLEQQKIVLNDLSSNFFLATFNRARGFRSDISDETASEIAKEIASNFEAQLNKIELSIK